MPGPTAQQLQRIVVIVWAEVRVWETFLKLAMKKGYFEIRWSGQNKDMKSLCVFV